MEETYSISGTFNYALQFQNPSEAIIVFGGKTYNNQINTLYFNLEYKSDSDVSYELSSYVPSGLVLDSGNINYYFNSSSHTDYTMYYISDIYLDRQNTSNYMNINTSSNSVSLNIYDRTELSNEYFGIRIQFKNNSNLYKYLTINNMWFVN